MKYWALICIIPLLAYSCSNEADAGDSTQESESVDKTDQFSINREVFEIDSLIAKKTDMLGHPWIEVSFLVNDYHEELETKVTIDVTGDERKIWIDPPVGDTSGAIVTLINRGEHVKDYYRPLKKNGKSEGYVELSNITESTLDIDFHAVIDNAINGDSIADEIELFGTFYGVKIYETGPLGIIPEDDVP